MRLRVCKDAGGVDVMEDMPPTPPELRCARRAATTERRARARAAPATQVLPLPASGASQTLDFSSQLLFPSVPVDPASVAVQVLVAGVSKSEAPINVVAGAAGQSVTVYNAGQTDARYSVRVTVDQSSYSTTKKM